jgi:hypothetical protein
MKITIYGWSIKRTALTVIKCYGSWTRFGARVLIPIPPPTILSPLHHRTQDRKATSYTTSSLTYINKDVDHFMECDTITPF